VTHSESSPTVSSPKTLFNLVPCNQGLEVAFSKFVGASPDVVAFAKNAGPQSLRIDYLSGGTRLAFYTPDFFVHGSDNNYFLVETKGRADQDVSAKARAAAGWCKAASSKSAKWNYVYVPQGTFERLSSPDFNELISLCRPALADLLVEAARFQPSLPFEQQSGTGAVEEFVSEKAFAKLPSRYQNNIEQAVILFKFLENKENMSFSPVFTPLLGAMEDACNTLILARLQPAMPTGRVAEKDFFNPIMSGIDPNKWKYYQEELKKLERTLVFRSPILADGTSEILPGICDQVEGGPRRRVQCDQAPVWLGTRQKTAGGSRLGLPIQEQIHRSPRARNRDEGACPRAINRMVHGSEVAVRG
jgi:type III restriction enzyme